MKRKIFIAAAVIFSSQAQAQKNANTVSADTAKTLDEVVMTANKFSRKQSETGKVITVIGREVLEKSFGRTVGDVLNQQTSVVVPGSQNILGSNQDLYLRGSGKVLLLIDGVPAYDASSIGTAFDLNQLPVENIERIEILKGGQSTLYGSDAVAGVINIISKKKGTKPVAVYGGLGAGSFSTWKVNAGINGSAKKSSYNINYHYINSKGFSAANDKNNNNDFDRDGFRQNAVSGNFTVAATDKLQLRFNGQFSKYKTDLDAAAFTDENDNTASLSNYQGGINAQYKLKGGTVFFNANYNSSERRYENDSSDIAGFSKYSKEKYKGNAVFLEAYTSKAVGKVAEILFGADYRSQNSDQDYLSISSFGPYKTSIGNDSVKNNMYSVFASLLLKNLDGFNAEIGGRYNKHSQYGNSFTYTFNPSYNINSNWKIFANVSSAFKAPSLYQLFGPGVENRKLEAEKSVTYEGGFQFADKKFTGRAVYFYRTINDGIDYNFETNSYFNNNRQKDNGLELEAALTLKQVSVSANYAYITGKVNTAKYEFNPNTYSYTVKGDTTFNNLFRRPKHTINFSISWQATKNLNITTSLRSVGKRYEGQFDARPLELSPYYTMDVYAGYAVNRQISFFADIRNITNQTFFDVLGYNARKFNMMAGVRCNF